MKKRKKYYDIKGFLKDAANTIWCLPIHLILGIYAAFAQCVVQLKYDVTNNIHEVYDANERQD